MRNLLVIDDDPNLVEYIKAVMETQPSFAVREAHDGTEGFETACKHPPHVVLLDVNMPGQDGLSVLRLMKADPRTSDAKVIMMTGVPSDAVRSAAQELGADGFMPKPFLPGQMLDHISRAMDLDHAPA